MISYKPGLDNKLSKEIEKISGSFSEKSEIWRQFGEKMVLRNGLPEIVK